MSSCITSSCMVASLRENCVVCWQLYSGSRTVRPIGDCYSAWGHGPVSATERRKDTRWERCESGGYRPTTRTRGVLQCCISIQKRRFIGFPFIFSSSWKYNFPSCIDCTGMDMTPNPALNICMTNTNAPLSSQDLSVTVRSLLCVFPYRPAWSSLQPTSEWYLAGWEGRLGVCGPGWVGAWLWKVTSPLHLDRALKAGVSTVSAVFSASGRPDGCKLAQLKTPPNWPHSAWSAPWGSGRSTAKPIHYVLVWCLPLGLHSGGKRVRTTRDSDNKESSGRDRRGLTEVAPTSKLSVHKEDGLIYIFTTTWLTSRVGPDQHTSHTPSTNHSQSVSFQAQNDFTHQVYTYQSANVMGIFDKLFFFLIRYKYKVVLSRE